MKLYHCAWLALATLWACGTSAPTDEQLRNLCTKAGYAVGEQTTQNARQNAFQQVADGVAKSSNLNKMTAEQVDMLFDLGGSTLDPYFRNWLAPVLAQKKAEGTVQGAFTCWKYFPRESAFEHSVQEVEALKAVICHPDIATFVEQHPDEAASLLEGLEQCGADSWLTTGMVPQVKQFIRLSFTDGAVVNSMEKIFNAASVSAITPEDKEEIRLAVLEQLKKAATEASTSSKVKRINSQIAYLQGAYATGKLLNQKAPAIHFQWISDGNEKSLDDFLGKVVVLDFWATKCAPCLAMFPKMAELQAYYQGKDVVIIGITSVQGYFVDKPNQKTISTAGHPEKEMALMPPYMKAMGMTWRVAFSEEDVMNPEYGALSIPHFTIIDKKGNVRYNHVEGTNDDKMKLIDGLLNE